MPRFSWLDAAKAYGIFLVFYGHIMYQMAEAGSAAAMIQMKLVYSFHMPLFFVLSGYLAKQKTQSYRLFLEGKFFSRLVPVFFFGLIALPFWMWRILDKESTVKEVLISTLSYAAGRPYLNAVTWFIVCLFVVENICFWIMPWLQSRNRTLLAILGFYSLGSLIIWKIELVSSVTGVQLNFWYIHEALIATAFYLTGYFLKTYAGNLVPVASKRMAIIWLLPSLLVLIATFDLNRGPFVTAPTSPMIIMAASQHGNVLLFPLTALVGIMFIMSIAQLTPANHVTRFIGASTLCLLGLNGLFWHFFNDNIIRIVGAPSEPFRVLGLGLVVATISILVCLPFVFLLNRYLPQLIGKPETEGPILPNLQAVDYRQIVTRANKVSIRHGDSVT